MAGHGQRGIWKAYRSSAWLAGIAAIFLAPGVSREASGSLEAGDMLDCDSGERFQILSGLPDAPAVSSTAPEDCSWQPVEGAAFLPQHVRGMPMAAGSLGTAKAHCTAMGQECAGITLQPCRWNEVIIYSLRAEADPQVSPQGETSWVKVCGAHASDAVVHQVPAAPPGASDCDAEHFMALREAAAEFYASGVVSVNLLVNLGTVLRGAALGGWDHIASDCAPAVLLTLLLRQEERLFVEREEQASLQETYFDILHKIAVSGESLVSLSQMASWPLMQGWNRLKELRQSVSLGSRRPDTARSVDFVLCFCSVSRSPGGGYPAVEDELGWLAELLAPQAAEHRQSTRVFVKEKCGDAVKDGFEDALRAALLPYAHVVEVKRVDDALRADDATAYLDHLSGMPREELAAWTFFLHADAPEHVHPFRLLEEVLVAARSGALDEDFPFLYLSHNYLDLGTSLHTWDNYASPRLWKHLFGSSVAPPREVVKGYCCVQFLVPRARALLRSRDWYARALSYFASEVSYFDLFPAGHVVTWQDLTCRTPAQLWMPWWHVVFGEELTCPERHQDRRLPLFVQLRSIPPDRIHCC
eukprot:TRINITY_DN36692_c0_g1_i2.p1 TRINITY_DN36692_c0_g1~~TRINITY_DN36692_c0_g1_i2.p1  ORF type:complete len:585 (-),score=124.50 TRINITY_DN36692_c0_g1_i2:19-1773(-)